MKTGLRKVGLKQILLDDGRDFDVKLTNDFILSRPRDENFKLQIFA